jgi:galactokinase
MDFINLFVPGCVCLFGEHSDWTGEFRRIDPSVSEGYSLAVGTNQGFYATARKRTGEILIKSSLPGTSGMAPVTVPMEPDLLRGLALSENFFAPAAGVALELLEREKEIGGLELFFYRSDLPWGRGFFPSAAVAVLAARAFRIGYGLTMKIDEEIECARGGQKSTGSPGGRMAQVACAYGFRPVFLMFDGANVIVQPLVPASTLHLVIASFGTGPEEDGEQVRDLLRPHFEDRAGTHGESVRRYLETAERDIMRQARDAILFGDPEKLGALMQEAQNAFDTLVAPVDPSLFGASKLKETLHDGVLKTLALGGKRLGTAPNGAAVFAARGPAEQRRLLEYLNTAKERTATALPLTIPGGRG